MRQNARVRTDALRPTHPDSEELSDGELTELVRETFRCEVGHALDTVRVGCLNGLVILSGVVASDELRQIAEQIVCDEMSLAMLDRVTVSPLAAETYAYRRRPEYAGDYASELGLNAHGGDLLYAYDVYDTGADLYESPPDRPVAEWE